MSTTKRWLGYTLSLLMFGVIGLPAGAQQPGGQHGPGQQHEGHNPDNMKSEPATASRAEFKVLRSFSPPEGFIGNLTYDQKSGRLWLVSLGPPANTKGPSTIYEVDPADGRVLARAELPFKGVFGSPVYIDGYLYQGVFHESKMYKIVAGDRANLGKIVQTIPLPMLNDLKLTNEEIYKFPFIEFLGVAVTPDKNILIHAADLGEFITLDRETGKVLSRVRTLKGLGGISGVPAVNNEFLILGNYDAEDAAGKAKVRRFVFRAPHPIIPTKRTVVAIYAWRAEDKIVSWVVLDAKTGNPLASIDIPHSPVHASGTALIKHENVAGTPYGRFTFLAAGMDGILTIEWTPSNISNSF